MIDAFYRSEQLLLIYHQTSSHNYQLPQSKIITVNFMCFAITSYKTVFNIFLISMILMPQII
jgi:hypothetical protein